MQTNRAQNRVLVLDKNKQPLMPTHPARARQLLKQKKAVVYRRFPFTIMLLERVGGHKQPVALKIDPGSKTTGIAIVATFKRGMRCIFAVEITHRGATIKKALEQRRNVRLSRRHRKTRYRKPRFNNRTRPIGWLPPSLKSRVDNIASWTRKLRGFIPITSISQELVRFDMQALENPEISGLEYQQGTLQGYEIREYLLEKWHRQCAYCAKTGVPLQIEHIIPRARGGTNRISNLTLACEPCNQKKGAKTATEFGYPEVQAQAKRPLRDAAAVNITRYAIHRVLCQTGLPVETGTGGQTKYNRSKQGYHKTHWLDAACVGQSGELVFAQPEMTPLAIKAMGRGSRQMCRVDKYGSPRTAAKKQKRVHGFQTGDIVKANVPSGKKAGRYIGRVAVRSSGSFNIKINEITIQGIGYQHCKLIQRTDGYAY
jgi:5-methylcytosine-specific restriction endonuclease McrA